MNKKIYKTYEEAAINDNYYAIPLYKKFREVKVIDRCECCNHKTGSHIENRPIGKPIGYLRHRKNATDKLIEFMTMDITHNLSEGLKDCLVSGTGEIRFKRYSPLSFKDIDNTNNIKNIDNSQKLLINQEVQHG